MSLSWSEALRAAGRGNSRGGPSALTRPPGGDVSGRRITRLGLSEVGGNPSPAAGQLGGLGKIT